MSVASIYILEVTHKQALNVLAEAYKQLVQAQSNYTRFRSTLEFENNNYNNN
jgi:hypothetical protein